MISHPAKRVFFIAVPAIAEAYLLNLLGVVDVFFIAKLGLLAINAVGVTNVYNMTFTGVFIAVSSALSVFLSRSVGAKQYERGRSAIWHGFLIAVAIGLITSLVSVIFAKPLLDIMGAHGKLQLTALPYFLVVLGSSPLISLFIAQSAAFRAVGNTKTPLRVGLEMNILHVVFDYLFIFGIGSFHGWGLKGAGLAMVCARIYALIRLWMKTHQNEFISLFVKDLKLSPLLLWAMIKFAVPAAVERLSMRLGQVIYFGLIVRMGIEVYATHNIAGTLTAFASTIGNGYATAATATIGQAIGSGNHDEIKAYRRWCYLQSAVFMTVVTVLLCIFSPWLGLLFTHDKQVIHLLFVILFIDIFSQPFLASSLVDTSAIQAGGNSKYPMIVTSIGIWGVRTLGVYIFGWRLGFGLPAVWISIALDNGLRAILFATYRNRKTGVKAV